MKQKLADYFRSAKEYLAAHVNSIWAMRPNSKHPLVVAFAVGLGGTLLVPFSARYAEVQRIIAQRADTREELVHYSTTVNDCFRLLIQTGRHLSGHKAALNDISSREAAIQEAVNRTHNAKHVLDAHIAFRFRNPLVMTRFNAYVLEVNLAMNVLADFNIPISDREKELEKFWRNSQTHLNRVVQQMEPDISPPARRIYSYVFFGRPAGNPESGLGSDEPSENWPPSLPEQVMVPEKRLGS